MKIAVLPGDGIGTEIVAEAVKVLKALDLPLEMETALVGGAAYDGAAPAPKGEKVAIKGEDGWESAEALEGNRQFMARRMKNYKTPALEAADTAVVVINALHHELQGIDLMRPHDHELLLTGEQHHAAADGPAEVAFFQEALREGGEVGDLLVVLGGELIDG